MQKVQWIWRAGAFFWLWLFTSTCLFGASEEASPMTSVVGIRANIPEVAKTSRILGTQRVGSGIVIDDQGLVVTIGYLILEAETVEIIAPTGETFPATIIAHDTHSGLGLLRSSVPLNIAPIPLGDSAKMSKKDPALVINRQGIVAKVFVGSRQTFTGSWEYLVDEAIFTVPAVSDFSGAALLNHTGQLVGVGSLFLKEYGVDQKVKTPSNMFVPIETLTVTLKDLMSHGRPAGPPRPWLGINVVSRHGHLMVQRVVPTSPADFAGIHEGDIILAVNGQAIQTLEMLFKNLWKTGQAGTMIPLKVLQRHRVRDLKILSEDRYVHYELSRVP